MAKGLRPYCRVLSDWEVEQAYADWDGGNGKALARIAEEFKTTSKTLERAFERLEAAQSLGDGPGQEQEGMPRTRTAEKGACTLTLSKQMPNGTVYRLELGMREDAARMFAEIVWKVMGA